MVGVKERLELVARLTGLGTVTALAEAAGIKSGTAQKHKDRDSLPVRQANKYIAAAAERGVPVQLDWLLSGRGMTPMRTPGWRPPAEAPPPPSVKIVPPDGAQDVHLSRTAIRLPLWQHHEIAGEEDSLVPRLRVSDDKVGAPEALRDIHNAFAVRMWDQSNGPYLPRGTILYVERPYGGAQGALCLFAAEATQTELLKPVVGILEKETDKAWHIVQHTTHVDLPKDEFRLCWRIRHFMRD